MEDALTRVYVNQLYISPLWDQRRTFDQGLYRNGEIRGDPYHSLW